MLVRILKAFPCAIDAQGVTSIEHPVGAVVDIADDLVPGLKAEGYVSLGEIVKVAVVDSALAGTGEGIQLPTFDAVTGEAIPPVVRADPFDRDGDGKPGGAPRGGNRKKLAA